MCGLIGVVTSDSCELQPQDPQRLVQAAQALSQAGLTDLEEGLVPLESQVQALFLFPSFVACLEDEVRGAALRQAATTLSRLAERLEGEQERAELVETRERLSAVAIRVRDMAWNLEQDLLPNLLKVTALGSIRPSLERSRAFELWKINTLLNGIDRLEVRGRDSAGLVLQVHFPSSQALSQFADGEWGAELVARESRADFVDGAISRAQAGAGGVDTLLLAYKVAHEIGEMGQNVAELRQKISSDGLLQAALALPQTRVSPLAHTRWASNGVISEPNCHPLDNSCLASSQDLLQQSHRTVAVLNGDIDNYQPLKERLQAELGVRVPPTVTTDAKIIPLWIDRNLAQGMAFEEAFRRAVAEFQGSMAIAVQSTLEPGKVYLALRGSGQSVYVGLTEQGFVFASELYGLIEETRRFIKMDGEKERVPGDASSNGQVAILDAGWGQGSKVSLRLTYYDGTPVADVAKLERRAEITTRDINRAGFEHFMLKEITESVGSVRKTMRGRYQLEGDQVHFTFVDEVFPPKLQERIRQGRLRQILCVGQGTAAVAGQGIAAFMGSLLAEAPVEISALKATELSGFRLRPRMEDTLVIAVSQSGTTTDTNRTIDLVRERGALVVGVVNRRNSDLVYKADAVFYTSDGRDVEMSVASTKAFYAQVVAGSLIALALARLFGTLTESALREELHSLEVLPRLIGKVLEDHTHIRTLAETHAVRHRHWAVVGNGANKVAADEIRIKLSELCYKAIACDFTEDKKHIDLSSEPLILVCAAGLSSSNLQDVVKEVAIFKAHKARPVVITVEGENRFDPYAVGVIQVPRGAGRLSFILTTVAGHLWGYYAARALDAQAQVLRRLRAHSVSLYERLRSGPRGVGYEALTSAMRAELGPELRKVGGWLASGALDSGLPAAVAVRLSMALNGVVGRIPLDDLVFELGGGGPAGDAQLFEAWLAALTGAINELTRPIDAIKHQAKTVTVGISRSAAPTGKIFEVLETLGVPAEAILPSHLDTLQALAPLLDSVKGSVHYALEGLSEAGEPGIQTRLRVLRKSGVAERLSSRADQGAPLLGTKFLIARERRVFVGQGSGDGRNLVIFPLVKEAGLDGLMLLHVAFRENAGEAERVAAVRHYRNRYDRLLGYVTELNLAWEDSLLVRVPVPLLFEGSPEAVAEALRHSAGQPA